MSQSKIISWAVALTIGGVVATSELACGSKHAPGFDISEVFPDASSSGPTVACFATDAGVYGCGCTSKGMDGAVTYDIDHDCLGSYDVDTSYGSSRLCCADPNFPTAAGNCACANADLWRCYEDSFTSCTCSYEKKQVHVVDFPCDKAYAGETYQGAGMPGKCCANKEKATCRCGVSEPSFPEDDTVCTPQEVEVDDCSTAPKAGVDIPPGDACAAPRVEIDSCTPIPGGSTTNTSSSSSSSSGSTGGCLPGGATCHSGDTCCVTAVQGHTEICGHSGDLKYTTCCDEADLYTPCRP